MEQRLRERFCVATNTHEDEGLVIDVCMLWRNHGGPIHHDPQHSFAWPTASEHTP